MKKNDHQHLPSRSGSSYRKPKVCLLQTKALKNVISTIQDSDVVLLHCCGLPGCGKTQLIHQLQSKFPFNAANNEKVIEWSIRCNDGHDIERSLKTFVERLNFHNYVTEQQRLMIQYDLEDGKTTELVNTLSESLSSVLIVIEDLQETDSLLLDLVRCLNDLKSIKSPSFKFHVYVTSRLTSVVCEKDEISEFRENGHLKYETISLDGFDKNEALDHLCKNRSSSIDERNAAEKIFERFSGLPLAMQIVRKYCSRPFKITYKKYLEQTKTISLQKLLQNEANSMPYDYSKSHPFESIAYPLVATSTTDGVELFYWNYLACLARLHVECIPEVIWKPFYKILDPESRSKPTADLEMEAEDLIRKLVDWSTCSIRENNDISLRRIVANAFLLTRQKYSQDSEDDFNSLKTAVEVMSSIVTGTKEKESLKLFHQHLLRLQNEIDANENASITNKEKNKLKKCIKICSK